MNTIFSKILQIRISKEDFKKEYRQIIKNVINSSQEEGFIEEIEDDTDVITDFFDSNKKIKNNIDLFKRLNENKQVQTAIANVKSISKKYSEKAENEKQKNTPIKLVEKAINSIESINRGIICSLTKEDKTKLINELKKLKSQVDNLILKEE